MVTGGTWKTTKDVWQEPSGLHLRVNRSIHTWPYQKIVLCNQKIEVCVYVQDRNNQPILIAPRLVEHPWGGIFWSRSGRRRSPSRSLLAGMILWEMHVPQQMLRTCTQRLNRDSKHATKKVRLKFHLKMRCAPSKEPQLLVSICGEPSDRVDRLQTSFHLI